MNIRKSLIAIPAVIASLAGASAYADTVNVRFTGTGRGQSVRIDFPGGSMNVFAGQLNHELTNGVGPQGVALEGNWATFCTDITQHVTNSPLTYDIVDLSLVPNVSPMGNAKADALRDVYAYANGAQAAGNASNEYAAAFQLAVWEIVTDYDANAGNASLSIAGGGFRATQTNGSALSSNIQNYLASFFGSVGSPGGATLLGLRSSTAQDQIIPTSYVPAPGSAVLGGLGGLCMGIRRRRTATR